MKNAILIGCIGLTVLAGCASSGQNFDDELVREIKLGVTTETDMIDMFGEPTGRSFDSSGSSNLTWAYHESRTNGKSFIPYVGMFMGGTDNSHKMLTANINPEGIVMSYSGDLGGTKSRGHTQSKNRS